MRRSVSVSRILTDFLGVGGGRGLSVDSRGWGRVRTLTEPSGPLLAVDFLPAGLAHVAALPEWVEGLHDGLILADDFVDSLLQRLRVDMRSRSRRSWRWLLLLRLLCLKVSGAERFPVLRSLHQPHHVPGPGVAGEGIRLRVEAGGRVVTTRVNLLALLPGQTWGVVKAGETLSRWRKLTGMFTGMVTRMFTGMVTRVIPRMVSGEFTGIPWWFTEMFSLLVNNMVAI